MFQGPLEVLEGFAQTIVFVGIEDGNGLADDLCFGIALNMFGAFVPAFDATFGIDEKDGVVFYVPDQKTEMLFEFVVILFGGSAPGKMIANE